MSTTIGTPPTILRDMASCAAVAQDYGGYIHNVPAGTFQPTLIEDIAAAVRYANQHGIKLAVRGAGHSTHGQAQARDGLVLDMRKLNRVLEVTPDAMWVEGGTLWRDVAHASFNIGRTFPVFTDYLATTVGGTLAVGGVGSRTWRLGAQTDHVLELEVLTANAAIVRCSPSCNVELFDSIRCGLGQFGIITKARLRLIPAPQQVVYYRTLYEDQHAFLDELHKLVDEGAYECIQGFALGNDPQSVVSHIGPDAGSLCLPAGTNPWLYCIELVRFLDSQGDPAAPVPCHEGCLPGGRFAVELPYLAYIDRLGPVEAMLTQLGLWQLPHPMLDLLLPGSQLPSFVSDMLLSVHPADVAGPVLIYPYARNHLHTPFFRVPDEQLVALVGLMRTTLPPTPEHVHAQIDDNRRLYEHALVVNGCYYPVDSVPMTPQDWQRHFGEQWSAFAAAKQRWDPTHLFNPGQAIFEE